MSNSPNNNHNKSVSDNLLSWIVVGISLLLVWPVGLFLLIRKLNAGASARTGAHGTDDGTQRQDWRDERDKWQRRTGNWGRKISDFIDSFFNTVADGARSSAPHENYYNQSESAGGTPRSAYRTDNARMPSRARTTNSGQRAADNPAEHANTAHRPARSGKGLSIVLSLLGVILGLGGVVLASLGISQYVVYGLSVATLLVIILGLFCLLGGVSCFITRGVLTARMRRFTKYAAVIGASDVVSVADIAKTIGDTPSKTRRTLQLMINNGFFGTDAFIDSSLDSFVRSYGAAVKARSAEAGERGNGSVPDGNRYVAVINELHMLCNKTSDPVICDKIRRIEDLTAKIFRTVEDHPEKKPQIRRFMNFYLPTTIKLLHSYETLEKQGVGGENIQSAKQDIERILDTLVAGFEQQLDHLFVSDKLDISSDIDVLENLMEQDGLTSESPFFRPAGGQ